MYIPDRSRLGFISPQRGNYCSFFDYSHYYTMQWIHAHAVIEEEVSESVNYTWRGALSIKVVVTLLKGTSVLLYVFKTRYLCL